MSRPITILRILLLFMALLTAFVAAGHLRHYFVSAYVPDDFGAFYCGGNVALHRQDPYLAEPLLTCERRLGLDRRWGVSSIDAVSAVPLPGYAFVPLMALAAMPVRVALIVFGLLLLAATAITGYCLARMSALPPVVTYAAAFIGTAYFSATLGQITPFAIAALAAAALLLRLEREKLATIVASGALLQPQIGLPVMLALFVFVPKTRGVVIAIGAAAACLSVAAVGLRGFVEYPSVLSVHARSELNAPYQYSFTWLAHQFGANSGLSLALGNVLYAVSLAICFAILARSHPKAVQSGAITLLPPAFAVFGGTFIHAQQIAVALLPALVLVRPESALLNPMLGAAMLAVPFTSAAESTQAFAAVVLGIAIAWCVGFFPARAEGIRSATRGATQIAIVVGAVFMLILAARPVQHSPSDAAVRIIHNPAALASSEDIQANDAIAALDPTPVWYYIMLKVPLWFGLFLTLWFSARYLLESAPAQDSRRRFDAGKSLWLGIDASKLQS